MATTIRVIAAVQPPPGSGVRGLVTRLRRVAQRLRVSRGDVTVVLQGDREMSRLHRRYKKARGTTDVLTFDLSEIPGRVVGEVHVCVDVALRRAEELGHPLQNELLLYAVHGLLHLCGYDDTDARSFRAMHAKEDELLRAIGVGDVFARRGGKKP